MQGFKTLTNFFPRFISFPWSRREISNRDSNETNQEFLERCTQNWY